MKQRDIAAVLLFTAGLVGCDSLKEKIPFLGKKKETPVVARRPATTPAPAPVDSAPKPAPAPAPASKRSTASMASAVDEPWTATDTGTVNPGMTREQVVAIWGVPVAERSKESWGYLYFRNGCEVTCGTFDVVFLENNQVVDAVVRAAGHQYSGNSSSPAGRKPEATGAGTQLAVPATQSTAPAPAPADSQASRPVAPAPAPAPQLTR